ncbi:hypothetical protein [Streptomyces sp. SBT349]|uniref:hypothetical protein n=1 Tax=Streptomyces sp. SBT349 TaxID=1580539 RepID=UPI00066AAEDC|nr:hypothetical protein [Streptomyces sp. SBT349]
MTARRSYSRRALLGAGAAAGAGLMLGGCGTGRAQRATNVGKDLVPWPEYLPAEGPPPDLAGDADAGIQQGYLRYPTDLVTSVPERPGRGEEITVLLVTNEPPPSPPSRNRMWRAVNEALGVELKLSFVPSLYLPQRVATMMASEDMPDVITCMDEVPRIGDFVATKCADLTPYLSGSAVRDYPNLANLPTYAWSGVGRFNGRLMGVPIERPQPSPVMLCNRDAFDGAGGLEEWTPEEFRERMRELTADRRWASGCVTKTDVDRHAAWRGGDNLWSLDGAGAFHPVEATEAYADALGFVRDLVSDGVFYPDQITVPELKIQLFGENVFAISDTLPAYQTGVAAVGDSFALDMARPYATGAGAGPKLWSGPGWVNYTILKDAEPERIRLILRVLDYLAAPFGSREYEVVRFGVEGAHYTRDEDGEIVLTDLADLENYNTLPLQYLSSPPLVAYNPGFPEATRRQWQYQVDTSEFLVANPATGLRTAAKDRYGTVTEQILVDACNDIVNGRAPVTSWDGVLRRWRDEGGVEIAEGLQAEYEAVHGR